MASTATLVARGGGSHQYIYFAHSGTFCLTLDHLCTFVVRPHYVRLIGDCQSLAAYGLVPQKSYLPDTVELKPNIIAR